MKFALPLLTAVNVVLFLGACASEKVVLTPESNQQTPVSKEVPSAKEVSKVVVRHVKKVPAVVSRGSKLESIRKLLPETITPISTEHLNTKVPHSYYFDYDFEPQPGKRLWRRMDRETWHEVYPDGLTSVFKVLGHARVADTEGTIVVKWAGNMEKTQTPNDGGLQAFIPDLGSATMHHWYRNTARGDKTWNDLAPMKDIW